MSAEPFSAAGSHGTDPLIGSLVTSAQLRAFARGLGGVAAYLTFLGEHARSAELWDAALLLVALADEEEVVESANLEG